MTTLADREEVLARLWVRAMVVLAAKGHPGCSALLLRERHGRWPEAPRCRGLA